MKAKKLSSSIHEESMGSSLPGSLSASQATSLANKVPGSSKRTRHEARSIYSSHRPEAVDLREKDEYPSVGSSPEKTNYEFNGIPLDKFMA